VWVEGVPHGEHDVEAEEEVQGERDVLKELQDIEVGCAEDADRVSLVKLIE